MMIFLKLQVKNFFTTGSRRCYDYSTRDQAFFLDTWNKLDVSETSGEIHFHSIIFSCVFPFEY